MSGAGTNIGIKRLERLQSLFVRLLFSESLLVRYRDHPEAVLAEFDLPPETRGQLPDPMAANFAAEARGRRGIIRREVARRFPRTMEVLEARAARAGGPTPAEAADSFLASDAFFDPARSLPHPTGVGPGYECVSKYFFWFRDAFGTARLGADADLRTAFNCDFAAYLLEQTKRPAHDYYKRFAGGIYWVKVPGAAAPVHLVSDALYFFEIKDPAKIAQLGAIGLQDLDAVQPADWPLEPNIR